MGYVTEVSKGKYRLVADLGYRAGKRLRKSKTVEARNKTEANKQLAIFEAELKSNLNVHFGEHSDITLNQFFKMWESRYAKTAYSPRTFNGHISNIENRILPAFGSFKLREISKIDVAFLFDDLQKDGNRLDGKKGKLAPSTIHNIFKAFTSMLSLAAEWEMIESNPCIGVKLPSLTYAKGSAYSEEEAARLIQLIEEEASYENQLIVKIAIVSGCREGEIAALEAKHLDAKTNLIHVEQSLIMDKNKLTLKGTKTGRERSVAIPEQLMKELQKHKIVKQTRLLALGKDREWPDHQFLFSNEFGKPLRPESIGQFWTRFVERNKLRRIRFHDLRHTSATLLINKGVHAKVIQERLGHSTIGTTMNVYGHVLEKADQTAAKHFDNLVSVNKK